MIVYFSLGHNLHVSVFLKMRNFLSRPVSYWKLLVIVLGHCWNKFHVHSAPPKLKFNISLKKLKLYSLLLSAILDEISLFAPEFIISWMAWSWMNELVSKYWFFSWKWTIYSNYIRDTTESSYLWSITYNLWWKYWIVYP